MMFELFHFVLKDFFKKPIYIYKGVYYWFNIYFFFYVSVVIIESEEFRGRIRFNIFLIKIWYEASSKFFKNWCIETKLFLKKKENKNLDSIIYWIKESYTRFILWATPFVIMFIEWLMIKKFEDRIIFITMIYSISLLLNFWISRAFALLFINTLTLYKPFLKIYYLIELYINNYGFNNFKIFIFFSEKIKQNFFRKFFFFKYWSKNNYFLTLVSTLFFFFHFWNCYTHTTFFLFLGLYGLFLYFYVYYIYSELKIKNQVYVRRKKFMRAYCVLINWRKFLLNFLFFGLIIFNFNHFVGAWYLGMLNILYFNIFFLKLNYLLYYKGFNFFRWMFVRKKLVKYANLQ